MKCKRVEKLIIEEIQSGLNAKLKSKFEAHLFQCTKCLSFKERYNSLRSGLLNLETPSPSEKLEEQTKALCFDELLKQDEIISFADQKSTANETPLTVWVAFIVLIGLTLIWAFPVLKDYVNDYVVTNHTIYLVMIVIQNILALMFAPILLRSLRLKKITFNYF